ncbi:MAG: GntR family transcriptional regulator [Gammaproteobacteria bacterium]|nr:MAG: GntR family transcriptional regulator [Gammaproteobacteria bacterium]
MVKVNIGQFNRLTITKMVDFGLYLDGGDEIRQGWGEILLPARYVPENAEVGQAIDVFVYFDSEDQIIATTEKPKACVGQFAYLKVVDVNAAGAFLDWGLPKDLLVPYAEQTRKMRQGEHYLVYVYQDDESERITASSKINRFLNTHLPEYLVGELLQGIVMAETDIGYKVIINHRHSGMLYYNEVFTPLRIGQTVTVNIKKIRDDGKIDLLMPQADKNDLSELENAILQDLKLNNGVLCLGDKTPPDVIYQRFSVSKKNFKRALSRLYKQRMITVEPQRICLTERQK